MYGLNFLTINHTITAGEELFISYGEQTQQNLKTLASYGFATDDPEQIDDIITFEKSELVRACMARLGFTRKICSLKVELAFETFEDKDWVDVQCNAETHVTKMIIGGASDDEESCKSSILNGPY